MAPILIHLDPTANALLAGAAISTDPFGIVPSTQDRAPPAVLRG
jgi:hypothetical protein